MLCYHNYNNNAMTSSFPFSMEMISPLFIYFVKSIHFLFSVCISVNISPLHHSVPHWSLIKGRNCTYFERIKNYNNYIAKIFRDVADLKYWADCLWLSLYCLGNPNLLTLIDTSQTAWDTNFLSWGPNWKTSSGKSFSGQLPSCSS